CTLIPGCGAILAPTVQRLTAANAGPMTGPGTNTYIVGRDGDFVVIDPGPALAGHVAAILQATAGRIRAVFVTHTHPDHSPAAAELVCVTGALRIGLPPPRSGPQDQ